jgi:hypothetical protein
MSEGQKTIITSLAGIMPKHTYNVNTDWDNCSVNLSAQTLLDIASYTQANLAKLIAEAQDDIEDYRFQLQETVEMCPVKEEWRYRTGDLLLSSLPTGGEPAVEDAESNQSVRLIDVDEVNPEWRYRTSDLQL